MHNKNESSLPPDWRLNRKDKFCIYHPSIQAVGGISSACPVPTHAKAEKEPKPNAILCANESNNSSAMLADEIWEGLKPVKRY
jgi:hypothetical protein